MIRLSKGEATVNEIAEPFRLSQQAISKHLAYLERAHLIEKRREGRQHFCTLLPESFQEVEGWIENCRIFWEASFSRLEDYIVKLNKQEKKHEKRKR